jgi:pyridoxal phosphate enzyme (YggS family)
MIAENINHIKQEVGHNVKLVVVSKFRTISEIQAAYDAGHRLFAENKVQPLLERYDALPKDIEWHLIGHLQTNKVKYITSFIHTIQSVDSLKLLMEINKQAAKDGRIIECLLQIYIAQEDTKFGLSKEECIALLKADELKTLNNIKLTGLMGMATFTDDLQQVEREFKSLKTFFDELKAQYNLPGFETISMGMSNDYNLAIACGSNLIRVGTKVFQ